jgi:hypothetical protein
MNRGAVEQAAALPRLFSGVPSWPESPRYVGLLGGREVHRLVKFSRCTRTITDKAIATETRRHSKPRQLVIPQQFHWSLCLGGSVANPAILIWRWLGGVRLLARTYRGSPVTDSGADRKASRHEEGVNGRLTI